MHPEMVNKLQNYRQFEDTPLADLLADCIRDREVTRLHKNDKTA